MINENDVIKSLSQYLESDGYVIRQSLTTTQSGIDIIAEKNGNILYVEAKGETSSKDSSKRFGLEFKF